MSRKYQFHNKFIAFAPSAFLSFNLTIFVFFIIPSGIFGFDLAGGSQLFSDWGLTPSPLTSILSLKVSIYFLLIFNIIYILVSSGRFILLFKIRRTASKPTAFSMNEFQVRLLRLFWIYSAFSVSIYFFLSGYQKLSLLGSGVDAWDYRMIGFDDTPVILKILLETSRRVLLPFLLITEIIRIKYNDGRLFSIENKYFFLLIFVTLISIASTLDRGPLLVFIMAFLFPLLLLNPDISRFIKVSSAGLITIGLLASIVTYLQYNVTLFSFDQIILSAFQFFLQRVFLDPSFTAISLGFDLFPPDGEFLNFRFSRIGVLFGAEYVGTESSDSIFVAPVGAIADAWRNYSYAGVSLTAILNALIAIRVDRYIKHRSTLPFSLSISFVYFSFALFQVFGVFYSMGAFFQIFFLLFFPILFKNRRSWY